MFRLRTARSICALLALSTCPAFATVVTYSDITAWRTATALGFSTMTFDSFSNQQFTTGLVIGDGTSFVGSGGQLWADFQNPGATNKYNFGSGTILEGPACCSGNITITLPTSMSFTSIGFDIMTYNTSGIAFTATLNNSAVVKVLRKDKRPSRRKFG